jgi:hypothetical protein
MAESSWPTWEVMQEHLENLTSQGYMTMVEIATCHMPEDPASPYLRGDTSWCAITSISLLPATVLWLTATSLDSFGGPAYGILRDLVRGQH